MRRKQTEKREDVKRTEELKRGSRDKKTRSHFTFSSCLSIRSAPTLKLTTADYTDQYSASYSPPQPPPPPSWHHHTHDKPPQQPNHKNTNKVQKHRIRTIGNTGMMKHVKLTKKEGSASTSTHKERKVTRHG